MAVIELDSLSKWYGEVIGLNNLTAAIGQGITGLLGPNGAGKSTLMGLVMGQLRPSQGTVRVFGESPWDRPRVLSRIGYCPEGDKFWPSMTGGQFVRYLARTSGLSRRNARTAAAKAIEAVAMTEHMDRAIRGYSKGMRQRIKVAQSLVHEPEMLVLDEPFTGADPVARHELANLFRGLAAQGVDILISSHVLHEIEALTKQILMIDHGRVVAQGDVQEVRRQIHNRPHAIRVRVDQPRRVAVGVLTMDIVSGVRIVDGDALVIETVAPNEVYTRLNEIILDEELNVFEITATDENLEAVFGYLTQRSA